jgi:hypothetical protein
MAVGLVNAMPDNVINRVRRRCGDLSNAAGKTRAAVVPASP